MPASDRELMVAFSEGNDEAFRDLFQRYRGPLVNFFYKMCYDAAIAEDLAQETFLRLIRHRGRYTPKASFRTYLYTVARNLMIDRVRSRRSAPKTVSTEVQAHEEGATLGDQIPSREPAPESAMHNQETAELIRKTLDELPESQRIVFILAEFQDLRYREIAEVLKVPEGTIKSRMHAAIRNLRGRLERILSCDPN